MQTKLDRMKELVPLLNQAAKAYYQEDREMMSNYEYDALYDELLALEEETATQFSDSPTANVGYEAVTELPRETHESPMLSLDKTKDVEILRNFIGSRRCLLSWKMDGLTIVLTYRDGQLYKAVTRGNGIVGEVITPNARKFANLPLRIPFRGELILRGEAIITYSDFNRINEEITDTDARYKNPRNLCSGSVRQLNSEITAARNVQFYAFTLVRAAGMDFENSHEKELQWLNFLGFQTVEYRIVTDETLDDAMAYFSSQIAENDFPSDGLVALYDDIAYGETLGSTAKFPRNSFAFKWADEIQETTLREVEWSASRTGLINPVAVFDPVELEGTTVSRASVHNVSIVRELELGIGDRITVYKANMIIPQIADNLSRSGSLPIPDLCPVCQHPTCIRRENEVASLYCTNSQCPAKKIKSFTLFVSRDAMNIDGLSEATLEKFIARGFLHDFGDLYELDRYKDQILQMEGFQEKSYQNLMDSIEKSRKATLPRLLYSLGILNVGLANAKLICQAFSYDLDRIRTASREEISQIEGIGPVIAGSVVDYFADDTHIRMLDHLLPHLEIEQGVSKNDQVLAGLTFVITGSLTHFPNRAGLKEEIESKGGKVTGSVTSKTSYLINNDAASNSSKNRAARELGIPVITEETFLSMLTP